MPGAGIEPALPQWEQDFLTNYSFHCTRFYDLKNVFCGLDCLSTLCSKALRLSPYSLYTFRFLGGLARDCHQLDLLRFPRVWGYVHLNGFPSNAQIWIHDQDWKQPCIWNGLSPACLPIPPSGQRRCTVVVQCGANIRCTIEASNILGHLLQSLNS